MSRQRQQAGAGSINLQSARDTHLTIINQIPAPRDRPKDERVQARVHQAFLRSKPHAPTCYFVNVFNPSLEREITVTHVWFACDPERHVLTRRLPVRIPTCAQWETWIEANALPFSPIRPEWLARVRLADDTVIESVPRDDVPAAGYVPGYEFGWEMLSTESPAASGTSTTFWTGFPAVYDISYPYDLRRALNKPSITADEVEAVVADPDVDQEVKRRLLADLKPQGYEPPRRP